MYHIVHFMIAAISASAAGAARDLSNRGRILAPHAGAACRRLNVGYTSSGRSGYSPPMLNVGSGLWI